MSNINILIIILVIFVSLFLLGKNNLISDNTSNINFITNFITNSNLQKKINCGSFSNNIIHDKPDQNSIQNILSFSSLSDENIHNLIGPCNNKNDYLYETLDEQKRRILKIYTNIALDNLNKKCIDFSKIVNREPFRFSFIEIISANSSIDRNKNSRWRVDIMVQELTLHLSLRLILDFTIIFDKRLKNQKKYYKFPLPLYFIGYPSLDQMIPLPMDIVSTGPALILSNHSGYVSDNLNVKLLILNKVYMKNSDLVLGSNIKSNLKATPAINDTNLPSSKYSIHSKPFNPSDVKFPEKNYSEVLEKTGTFIDTNIHDNYTWKPPNYNKTGHPENNYHLTGSSETYEQSIVNKFPDGWVQNSKWRNKWPRLWSEPRDRFEYPSVPNGYKWNNLGILYPDFKQNCKHPGKRWSTQQTQRTPLYWPTVTGLPLNQGPNYWLFNQLRGFEANQPH